MSYESQDVFEDAKDESVYGDAEDDPKVSEPECSHCHRSCRHLINQEIRVFNFHVCNCRFVCQECVDRAVRRDRIQCRVCRKEWRNIQIEGPITYEQFLRQTRMDFYCETIANRMAFGVVFLLAMRFAPRVMNRLIQVDRFSHSLVSPSWTPMIRNLFHFWLLCWILIWAFLSVTTIFCLIWGLLNRLIRENVLPLAYRLYRPISLWRTLNFRIIEPQMETIQPSAEQPIDEQPDFVDDEDQDEGDHQDYVCDFDEESLLSIYHGPH